jgi:hypothetical protein
VRGLNVFDAVRVDLPAEFFVNVHAPMIGRAFPRSIG